MPELLNDHIARDGDAVAVVDAGGASTWRELGDRVNRWIHLLRTRGLGRGDRLACVLGNRRESFELLLACLHTGVTLVPVNSRLTEREIAYILDDSQSRALVVEEAYACRADPGLLRLVLGDRDVRGFTAVEPLLAGSSAEEPADQCCGATMLYTSGTTGVPKGVVNDLFRVGAEFSRVARLAEYARITLDVPVRERFLLDGPWYHSSQLFFAVLPLLMGCRLVIRPRFDPEETLAVIDREQITSAHLVPTQLVRLLRLPDETRRAFLGASLRRVWHGSGPCPQDVKHRMIDWWGPIFLEYYGATEGGAATLIDSHHWLRRPGSVGRALPPGELLVVGANGTPLPPGQAGRVFVRRRTGRTFRYHNAPDKTRSAHLGPDTFTYGDIGYLDDDGYLFLTGRAQDMIVSGGVNVYPAEVEAVLFEHPAVQDAAVIGVPDDEFGERVVAVVQPEPGRADDDLPALLDAHCRRSLAGFKVPRGYLTVRELPREPTGKIRKDSLRQMYQDPPHVG